MDLNEYNTCPALHISKKKKKEKKGGFCLVQQLPFLAASSQTSHISIQWGIIRPIPHAALLGGKISNLRRTSSSL